MKKLYTWGGRSHFEFEGSVVEGTKIYFAQSAPVMVSAYDYYRLLSEFQGQTVNIGTSRTDPPAGSVGEWLLSHVVKSNLMSYVGSILVDEGYAEAVGGPDIRFFPDCAERLVEGVSLEPLFHSEISSSYLVYDLLKKNQQIARAFLEWVLGVDFPGEVTVSREKPYPGKGTVDLYFTAELDDGSKARVLVEVKVHDYLSATLGQLETYYRAALEEKADDVYLVYLTQLNEKHFSKDWGAAEPNTIKEFEGIQRVKKTACFRHISWHDFYRFIEPYESELAGEQRQMLQLQKKWMLSKTIRDLENNTVDVGCRDLVEFFDADLNLVDELPFGKKVSKNRRVNYVINLTDCSEKQLDKTFDVIQKLARSASIDKRPFQETAVETMEGAKVFLAGLVSDESKWGLAAFYSSLFDFAHHLDYLHFNGTGTRGFSLRANIVGRGAVSLCTLWSNGIIEFSIKR